MALTDFYTKEQLDGIIKMIAEDNMHMRPPMVISRVDDDIIDVWNDALGANPCGEIIISGDGITNISPPVDVTQTARKSYVDYATEYSIDWENFHGIIEDKEETPEEAYDRAMGIL